MFKDKESRKVFMMMVAGVTAVICAVICIFFKSHVLTAFLSRVLGLLTPFIYGAVIAYLLRPVSLWLEGLLLKLFWRQRQKKKPGWVRLASILLSLFFLAGSILIMLIIVIPELADSIGRILSQIPSTLEQFTVWLESMDNGGMSHEIIAPIEQAIDTMTTNLQSFLQTSVLPYLSTMINEVTSSFMAIVDLLKNFGLGCIIAAYLLGGWERFAAQANLVICGLFPETAVNWIKKEAAYTDKMFSGFIHGKLLDSFIVGLICFVFMLISSMPYAVLISLIVGVTNMVPFFGPYLGAIPSVLILLTVSPMRAVIFLIFIIILQQFDGNILGPGILGDKLGLSGFWILFSILIFGSLWGVTGMLIGAPLFAVIYDLIRTFIVGRLREKGRDDIINSYREKYPEPERAEGKH